MNPVYRLMTLVDGGVYVARPSPDCALLRALCDGGGEEVSVGPVLHNADARMDKADC